MWSGNCTYAADMLLRRSAASIATPESTWHREFEILRVVSSAVRVQGEQATGWFHAYMQELAGKHMCRSLYATV
jgi:hypothetical protein